MQDLPYILFLGSLLVTGGIIGYCSHKKNNIIAGCITAFFTGVLFAIVWIGFLPMLIKQEPFYAAVIRIVFHLILAQLAMVIHGAVCVLGCVFGAGVSLIVRGLKRNYGEE